MRLPLAALLVALAPLAFAADVSGKWIGWIDNGAPDGSLDPTQVYAEFEQTGNTVTGTAGVPGFDPLPLEKGMLDGDNLTFEVHATDGLYAVKVAAVSGSQLRGEVVFTAPDGDKQTAAITLTRN